MITGGIIPRLHNAFTPGKNSRLCTILQMEFAQNIPDMALHGFLAHHQTPGNLSIGEAFRDKVDRVSGHNPLRLA
jgi:hypothetical protein